MMRRWIVAALGLMAGMSGQADATMTLLVSGRVFDIERGSVPTPASLGTTYTGTITYDEHAPIYALGLFGDPLYSPVAASFDLAFDGSFRVSLAAPDPGYRSSVGTASLTNTERPSYSADSFILSVDNGGRLIPGGGYESGIDFAVLYLGKQSTGPSDALTSTSLADFSPVLSKFDPQFSYIRIGSYASINKLIYNMYVSVESLQVTSSSVPEPSSMALCGVASLAGLVALARRRRAA